MWYSILYFDRIWFINLSGKPDRLGKKKDRCMDWTMKRKWEDKIGWLNGLGKLVKSEFLGDITVVSWVVDCCWFEGNLNWCLKFYVCRLEVGRKVRNLLVSITIMIAFVYCIEFYLIHAFFFYYSIFFFLQFGMTI